MEAEPLFLSEEEVLEIHSDQLRAFGGSEGVLFPEGLASAVVQPQQVYCYNPDATLFDLAAAYTFHIGKNHPFSDGNKRAAIACAIVFLDVNGWLVRQEFEQELTVKVLALMTDEVGKAEFAHVLQRFSVPKPGLRVRNAIAAIKVRISRFIRKG